MPYIVVSRFKDTQDNNSIYKKGDTYPKGDYKPTKKRIEELSNGEHPKYKRVFIEEVKEPEKQSNKK
jgi:predicted transcriptional regulator